MRKYSYFLHFAVYLLVQGAFGNNCEAPNFKCKSGECITVNNVCNNIRDCVDNSDEHNCDYSSCGKDNFQCLSGQCIPKRWECDGDCDCKDGSDEHENCRKCIKLKIYNNIPLNNFL